jgi:hypothetical protein
MIRYLMPLDDIRSPTEYKIINIEKIIRNILFLIRSAHLYK